MALYNGLTIAEFVYCGHFCNFTLFESILHICLHFFCQVRSRGLTDKSDEKTFVWNILLIMVDPRSNLHQGNKKNHDLIH